MKFPPIDLYFKISAIIRGTTCAHGRGDFRRERERERGEERRTARGWRQQMPTPTTQQNRRCLRPASSHVPPSLCNTPPTYACANHHYRYPIIAPAHLIFQAKLATITYPFSYSYFIQQPSFLQL